MMKLPYFKIKDAFNEAKDSFSYGNGTEKLSSTAKLLGKSVANVGMLAVELGVESLKNAPEIIGRKSQELLDNNSESMSVEQIEKANKAVELGKKAKANRLEKERNERDRDQ